MIGGMICLCHIRVRRAMALQNVPVSVLPFQAILWPYGTYVGFAVSLFFIIFQGWTSFVPWDVGAFFMNYIVFVLFVVLAASWKLLKKTQWVKLAEADLSSGRRDVHRRE
jgi:amino acid transporter